MALITANAGTFAHTNTAAWVGGVVPGVNDEVVIPATATITVASGTTWTLGNPATPTTHCLSVSGTLTINGTVQVNANIRHQATTGVIQVNAGAVLESVNTSTAIVYQNNKGTLRLRGTGVGAGRAIVRRGVGSAGFSYTRDTGLNDSNTLDSEWGLFQNMSTVAWTSFFSGGLWRMIDTVVDGCILNTAGNNVSASGAIEWRRVQQINSPSSPSCTFTGSATPTATRVLEDVAFDRAAFTMLPGFTVTRVIFRDAQNFGTASAGPMTDCVLYDAPAAAAQPINVRSSLLRGFRVRNAPTFGNWHGVIYNVAGTYDVDGLIADGVVADADGDLIQLQTSGAITVSIRNVLCTRSADSSGSYGVVLSLQGSATASVPVVENCTAYTRLGAAILAPGETVVGYSGMIGAGRNNLAVGLSAGSGAILHRRVTGANANIRDYVAPANLTNNAAFNAAAGGAGVGVGNTTAAGGDGVVFSTTPAAPLDVDPQFVDDTRNLATWYRSLVGGTPGTRSADTELAMQAMASQWGDSPVAGATITAAYAWIRAGYVPQAAALKTDVSANNGGWIGAMEGVVPPTPPTIASIAPTSGVVGTEITFTGSGFTGASLAEVNGTDCTGLVVDSDTQVRATVAAGSTTGAVSITTPVGSDTGPVFTVTVPPPTNDVPNIHQHYVDQLRAFGLAT